MKTKKRWLVGLVLLALALVALVLWRFAGPTDRAKAERPVARPSEEKRAVAPPPAAPEPRPELKSELARASASDDPTSPNGAFGGQVLNWGTGQPVPGAEVSFIAAGELESFVTDADGRFLFRPAGVRTYRLASASKDGFLPYAPALGESPIALQPKANRRLDGVVIYLTPEIEYRGIVVDSAGKPVANAAIEVLDGSAWARESMPLEVKTVSDAAGRFVFVAPDNSIVEAKHPVQGSGFAIVDGAVQISHEIRIELKAGGNLAPELHVVDDKRGDEAIRGRVVSSDGQPVVAFHVAVFEPKKGLERAYVTAGSFFADSGEFTIDGLAPGPYELVALADGFAKSKGTPATAGDAGRPVEIRLEAGGRLVGTVVDADNKQPLENAKVSVESNLGDAEGVPLLATAISDREGRFELRGLPIGRSSVTAGAYAHHPRIIGGLEAAAGETIGPMVIELSPTNGEKPTLELVGIGVSIAGRDGGLEVIKVFDGGGAADAGIREKDLIVAVDGRSVFDLGFDDALQQIRGPIGSVVTLKLTLAAGGEKTVQVVRKKLKV